MIDTLLHFRSFFALDSAAGGGLMAMGLGLDIVILLVACVVIGYPIYVLAQRANHATPWFAFIPILNIIILCQLAELEMFWVLLSIFVPFCGFYPWYKVAEKQGKNGWVCLGFLIPCVGFLTPYYIVFM
jgi:hypothetical protein